MFAARVAGTSGGAFARSAIVRGTYVVVVNPSLPARTLPEFLGYAKDSMGEVAMASAGATRIEPAVFL